MAIRAELFVDIAGRIKIAAGRCADEPDMYCCLILQDIQLFVTYQRQCQKLPLTISLPGGLAESVTHALLTEMQQ